MNKNQKRVTLAFIALIFVSVLYVPEEYKYGSMVEFYGYTFIWDLTYSIDLKIILTEWVGIILISLALYKYYE